MTKKGLKIIDTCYISARCTFLFGGLIIRTLRLNVFCLDQFYVGRALENVRSKHVSKEKTYWNDSCWYVEIIFSLKSDE